MNIDQTPSRSAIFVIGNGEECKICHGIHPEHKSDCIIAEILGAIA